MSWTLGNYGFINIDYISKESLCINDLGLETRRNEYYQFNNSTRDYQGYLFQYTLDGYGIYEACGIKHKLTKGKAFFITFPEESQYYLSTDDNPDNHWTFFYIHFSGPAAAPLFNRIRELSGPVIELELDCLPISMIFELYETLRNQGLNQSQLTRYMGSEWLYRFLISLLRYIETPPNRKLSLHVAAAMEWINMHYSEQINLEEMSASLDVTYSHLTRQFYKEQGVSPIEYLTHVRLEHGMQLLLNTSLTIDQIAKECGFSCANYFTKVYKRVLHITPSDYRRQHRP